MPTVYFKTVSQGNSLLPGAVSEDYYLELLLSETASCLNANAISYEVLGKDENLNKNILASSGNREAESVALTLQIDSSGDSSSKRQLKILFKDQNPESRRLAAIFFENIKKIYSGPLIMEAYTNDLHSQEEMNLVPSVKIILEQFLTPEDISWIRQNVDEISKQLIISLDEYFGLPFVACDAPGVGMAKKDESLRKRPNLNSEIIGSTEANSKVDVLGQWEDWYVVGKNHSLGYVQTKFIEL